MDPKIVHGIRAQKKKRVITEFVNGIRVQLRNTASMAYVCGTHVKQKKHVMIVEFVSGMLVPKVNRVVTQMAYVCGMSALLEKAEKKASKRKVSWTREQELIEARATVKRMKATGLLKERASNMEAIFEKMSKSKHAKK